MIPKVHMSGGKKLFRVNPPFLGYISRPHFCGRNWGRTERVAVSAFREKDIKSPNCLRNKT